MSTPVPPQDPRADRSAAPPAAQPPEADLLNPLTLPLDGTRLIEASAGTGKTWTIAALFVRLVLGHGSGVSDADGRRVPLLPAQVLVMTFTRAATRELADRIRQRLVEAAAVFRGGDGAPAPDPFLNALLAEYPGQADRETAAFRLAMAAEAMDDAAVLTIDAWCQRMLREHAFDSGCLFDEDLQADDRAMRLEAVADFWRKEVYPLDDAAMVALEGAWPKLTLSRLADALSGALDWQDDGVGAGPSGPQAQGQTLAQLLGQAASELAAVKVGWAARFEAMRDWLERVMAGPVNPFNGTKVKPASVQAHLQLWIDWANDPSRPLPEDFSKTLKDRYTPEWLADSCKKDRQPPDDAPEGFALLPGVIQVLQAMSGLRVSIQRHAARRIAQRYRELQREARAFGFSDLLRRLEQALDVDQQGERAERLRQRILAQTPVALVDEFQDTSPVQLSIFHRLYGLDDAGGHGRALLLIGDPKQSIYRFRGADIHSYLMARRATAGRHHRLGTNHRSTHGVVDAVNAIFMTAEQRGGPGAFMMRHGGHGGAGDVLDATSDAPGTEAALPADADALPFVPVDARGRSQTLQAGRGAVPPLVVGWNPTPARAPLQLRAMADAAADEIVALLADAQTGFVEAAPHGADPEFRRLRPADVAVLVRTSREAGVIRHALARRAVASVYLSDQDSVLASAEATDLLRLLRAIAQPRDVRLARAALATGVLGLSLPELQQLAEDDEQLDAELERLARLQAVWQQQGVLAMLRRLLHDYDLPARWLAPVGASVATAARPMAGGERRLTNVLHLAELLQQASTAVEGEGALVRWLAAAIDETFSRGGRAVDEQVLRLESDADLVQVVTIHKSKGLEYPVVFLPFVVQHRAIGGRGPKPALVVLPDGQGGNRVVMSPDEDDLAHAESERLREDLRLLYVALTRARHLLWLGLQPLDTASSPRRKAGDGGPPPTPPKAETKTWTRSAIGRLISGDGLRSPDQVGTDVAAWLAAVPGAAVQPLGASGGVRGVGPLGGDEGHVDDSAPVATGAVCADRPPAGAAVAAWPAAGFHRLPPAAALPPLARMPVYSARFDRDWGIGSYSALVASAVAGASPGGPLDAAMADALALDLRDGAEAEALEPASGGEPLVDPSRFGERTSTALSAEDSPSEADAPQALAEAQGPRGSSRPAEGPLAGHLPGRLSGRALLDDEPPAPATEPLTGAARPTPLADAPWHRFPRGALAGHVLHGLLEWLAGEGFALGERPHLGAQLQQRCERQGWGAHAEGLLQWLTAVCRAPLPSLGGASLQKLHAPLAEMEFWTPADGLDTARLDALCRRHLWSGAERPRLSPRSLKGLLMGFADLCFMHEGRAWVADYKSNALGPDDAAYTQDAMAEAVRHHRYDVQAALYQFALHRLLRLRMGDAYRPEQHLGGTLFLFLRGIQGPEQGVLHVPPLLPVMAALDAMLAGESAEDPA